MPQYRCARYLRQNLVICGAEGDGHIGQCLRYGCRIGHRDFCTQNAQFRSNANCCQRDRGDRFALGKGQVRQSDKRADGRDVLQHLLWRRGLIDIRVANNQH